MDSTNPFWDYSLRLYPGVAQWCLAKQDENGINVNLLLFCCYAGVCGRALDSRAIHELKGRIAGWDQSVVQPLRAIRRQLKGDSLPGETEIVRKMIKSAELTAEKQVQKQLFKWWQQSASSGGCEVRQTVLDNLKICLHCDNVAEKVPDEVIELAILAAL